MKWVGERMGRVLACLVGLTSMASHASPQPTSAGLPMWLSMAAPLISPSQFHATHPIQHLHPRLDPLAGPQHPLPGPHHPLPRPPQR